MCRSSGILVKLAADGTRQSHLILEGQIADTTVVATLRRHPEFARHSLLAMELVLALYENLLPTGVLPPEFFIVKKGQAAKVKKPPTSLELLKAVTNNAVAAIVTAMKKSINNKSIQYRGVACLCKIAPFDLPTFKRAHNGAISSVIKSIIPTHPKLAEELALAIEAIPDASSRDELGSMLRMAEEQEVGAKHRTKHKGLVSFCDPGCAFQVSRKGKMLFTGAKMLRRAAHPSCTGCIVNRGLKKVPAKSADVVLSAGSQVDATATMTLPCTTFQKILEREGGLSENEAYLCSMYLDSEMTGEIECLKLVQFLDSLRCSCRTLVSLQEVDVVPWLSKAEHRIQAKRGVSAKPSKMVMLTAFDARSSWTESVLLGKDDILELRKRRQGALDPEVVDATPKQPLSELIFEWLVIDTRWEYEEAAVDGDGEMETFVQALGFEFDGRVWAQR